ncbi:DUF6298 domain-containing protein [Oleiharenicola lentus]|uniref:DUF6298 domain-containing protein n=1 Tax=Oleiharenicola lentus TaxID=2508720 RepID=UPI003F669963
MSFIHRATAALTALALSGVISAKEFPAPVSLGKDGKLIYHAESNGDRVPDFSHAGYRGGGVAWPVAEAKVLVNPVEGDDGARIQAALDYVAGLPLGADGMRGAVQLAPGRYEIAGQIFVRASGVVLRGSGREENGTVLVATGTDRRHLIELSGKFLREELHAAVAITDDYVAVGMHTLSVADASGFKVGTLVTVERPSTAEWINFLGMDVAPGRQPYSWKPGAFNVNADRVVIAVEGKRLTLDAPITTALEKRFGAGKVTPYTQTGYLENAGIENLRCESAFDGGNPFDEQHAWNAIDLHAARDVWVSDVTAVHFAGSAIQVGARAARITIQDCASLAPVSEIGGYRRMSFHSRGQQVLFLRCRAEQGRNDFTTGYLAAGPIVFLECEAVDAHSFSGSVGSWTSGLLFDNVKIDGNTLSLDNRETWNQGVGWSAANSVIWESAASIIVSRQPPGAHNWAVATWGQFVGDGRWSMCNEFANPDSLYRAQLSARLGKDALGALVSRAYAPMAPTIVALEKAVPDLATKLAPKSIAPGEPLKLVKGWLKLGDKVLAGKDTAGAWWLGRLEPALASSVGPAITRFSPGRTGTGLTDEIPAVAARMVREGIVAFRHHYGLWYERRRIDHQMIRRPDAEVYPPFFEQPFARSGQGKAWDGLSRYDLTKYNPWYFSRLRTFAAEARQHGLVLINEMYFQHNIIESGAHWVDSPWRPVNNLNGTIFTEPPPFTGDTIKMADEFYDISKPLHRELHRAYIRQCLANLAGETNVIHTLSAENTGPLHFMQFWLDVIAEWERETGHRPLIALSATKDVQDAILADAERSKFVDVIDLTYWFRTAKGEEFAPAGGIQRAPRQNLRLWKGGRPTAASIADMAREYREKFPDKAVITGLDQAGEIQPR